MKPRLKSWLKLGLLALVSSLAQARAQHRVLEPASAPALITFVAGEPARLRLLPAVDATLPSRIRLWQVAGTLAIPLELPVTIVADAADARLWCVEFIPPPAQRAFRLALQFDESTPLILNILPARRDELASLAAAHKLGGRRLEVAGDSAELRAWLKTEGINYTDLGRSPRFSPAANTIGLYVLSETAWAEAAFPPHATGCVLGFVDSADSLPGVYPDPTGLRWKVTLPLLPRLGSDPLARETLHHLLLPLLLPATTPKS
jgi:hypothetical protein